MTRHASTWLVVCATVVFGCIAEVGDDVVGDDDPTGDDDVTAPDDPGDPSDTVPVAAVSGPVLEVGLTGNVGSEMFARGPRYQNGQWSTTNPYTLVLGRIAPGDLPARMQVAKDKGILIVLNMAGSRKQWTRPREVDGRTCLVYDPALYKARIDDYVGVPGLATALAERRVIVYVVDEPHIDDFCDSITPTEANQMGLYIKQKWPRAITLVRLSAETLRNGFAGQGPLGNNFWTGMDYGYGLYKGYMKTKLGKTPAQWYPEEKRRMAEMNLGMVIGVNVLNHGQDTCWDYKHTGSSWGRIRGQNQRLNGGIPCADGTGGETNWYASPAFLRSIIDAAVQDRDAPFVAMWTHITPDSNDQEFLQYEIRSDYIAAYEYMIAKGKQRTSWNGWRTAK